MTNDDLKVYHSWHQYTSDAISGDALMVGLPFQEQLRRDYGDMLREELARHGIELENLWVLTCSKVEPTAVHFCIDVWGWNVARQNKTITCTVYRLNQTIPPNIKLAALKLMVQL